MRGELSLLGYRIYSITRPGRLLNFRHFQQVYVYFATTLYMVITKREDVTKQGFCKIL